MVELEDQGWLDPEHETILDVLDEIQRALSGRLSRYRGNQDSRSGVFPTNEPATRSTDAPERVPAGAPSPYLEERLAVARRGLVGLQDDVREIHERSSRLGQLASVLSVEVHRASEELSFVRSHGLLDAETTIGATSYDQPDSEVEVGTSVRSRRGRTRRRADAAGISPSPGGESRYRGFTVQRYNATIGGLKRRWSAVTVVAIAISGVVSAILVAVAYATHGPSPPLWLAALPAVWMIPVPFFVLAFRGTRRILSKNHLELPEAE